MKAVILAGGLGTRISEESHLRPKPMIEVGNKPILWHIMKIFGHHGINDFVICCGYKGFVIKEFFANYALHASDVTIDLQKNGIEVHHRKVEPWRVTLVDTGELTQTGGRIKRIRNYVDGPFCLTYGDGVSDVNISALTAFHASKGKTATVTAIQPAGRFGGLELDGDLVQSFQEKPKGDGRWVSGGFFVLEPGIFDVLDGDATVFEREPVEVLAQRKELAVYRHQGFWAAMDTQRDKTFLEETWATGCAPWKVWHD